MKMSKKPKNKTNEGEEDKAKEMVTDGEGHVFLPA